MIYYVLLLLIAVLAYGLGSMSTLTIASVYVFRKRLRTLGKNGVWLSNFWRLYGIPGCLKLGLTELVRDALPILFAAILLGLKGHAEVGRAFAFFCLMLGRSFPLFYRFRGSHATAVLIVGAFFTSLGTGIAVAIVCVGVTLATRYLALGTLAGGIVLPIAALLAFDERMAALLCLLILAVIVVRHAGEIVRIFRGEGEPLTFRKDIMYKLDNRF